MKCVFIIYWPSETIYRCENIFSALKFCDFLGLDNTIILRDENNPLLRKCRKSWSL